MEDSGLAKALEMRRLLTCPLCNDILTDPSIISTCQHCFCFRCINEGIERGCAPCMLPWAPTDRIPASISRKKKVCFQCPVCGLAAFKWMLHRVAPLAAFVNRVKSTLMSLPLLPPERNAPSPPESELNAELAHEKGDNEPAVDRPPGGPGSASLGFRSSYVGSSMTLFDESLPLWHHQQRCDDEDDDDADNESHGGGVAVAQAVDAPPLAASVAVAPPPGASVSSYSSGPSLMPFLSTPPQKPMAVSSDSVKPNPTTLLDGHCDGSADRSRSQRAPSKEAIDNGARLATAANSLSSSLARSLSKSVTGERAVLPLESPIRFVPHAVRLLIDASLWAVQDPRARGKYLDVVHLAVARLGGTVINAVSANSINEIRRSPMHATHVVCLILPGDLTTQPTAALCEARLAANVSDVAARVALVGLQWVVESLERGAWDLGGCTTGADVPAHASTAALSGNPPPLPATASAPFEGIRVVLDLGCKHREPLDAMLLREVQSAVRLFDIGGAACIWIAHKDVATEAVHFDAVHADDAADGGGGDLGMGRRLFDPVVDADAQTATRRVVFVVSVRCNVRDAVSSTAPPTEMPADIRCDAASIVVRRPLAWLYRTVLHDDWPLVRQQLFDGALHEWEGQRPRVSSVLYS